MTFDGQERPPTSFVKVTGQPREESSHDQAERKGFFRAVGSILERFREFMGFQGARLLGTGMRIVEGEATLKETESARRIAEAADLQAAAAVKRQDVAIKRLAIANEIERSGEVDAATYLRKRAIALAELEDSISLIRQMGGDVQFEGCELRALLRAGQKEYPTDELLKGTHSDTDRDS